MSSIAACRAQRSPLHCLSSRAAAATDIGCQKIGCRGLVMQAVHCCNKITNFLESFSLGPLQVAVYKALSQLLLPASEQARLPPHAQHVWTWLLTVFSLTCHMSCCLQPRHCCEPAQCDACTVQHVVRRSQKLFLLPTWLALQLLCTSAAPAGQLQLLCKPLANQS